MIKLQDFAKQQGVTDRAIQKHLKTYASELEGLYQRKGPNGTWLTDEACEILRSKMKQQPIVVGDTEAYQEKERLEKENKALLEELKDVYKELAEQAEELRAADKALAEVNVLLLSAAKDKERADTLEAQNGDLRGELKDKDDLLDKERKASQKLSEELTEARTELEQEKSRRISFREFWQRRKSKE